MKLARITKLVCLNIVFNSGVNIGLSLPLASSAMASQPLLALTQAQQVQPAISSAAQVNDTRAIECNAVVEAAVLKPSASQAALDQIDLILAQIESGELRSIADIELIQLSNERVAENQTQIGKYLRGLTDLSADFGGEKAAQASTSAAKIAVLLERLEKTVLGEKTFLEKLYQVLPSLRNRRIKKTVLAVQSAHGQANDALAELKASQGRLKSVLPELDKNINLMADDQAFLLQVADKINASKNNIKNDKELEQRLELALGKVNECLLGLELLSQTAQVYRVQIDNSVTENFNQESQLRSLINNHLTLAARKLVGKTSVPLNFEPPPKVANSYLGLNMPMPPVKNYSQTEPQHHAVAQQTNQIAARPSGPEVEQINLIKAAGGDFDAARRALTLLQEKEISSPQVLDGLIELLAFNKGTNDEQNYIVSYKAKEILIRHVNLLSGKQLAAIVAIASKGRDGVADRCLSVLFKAPTLEPIVQSGLVDLVHYTNGTTDDGNSSVRDKAQAILINQVDTLGNEQVLELVKEAAFQREGLSIKYLQILERAHSIDPSVHEALTGLLSYRNGTDSRANEKVRDLAEKILKSKPVVSNQNRLATLNSVAQAAASEEIQLQLLKEADSPNADEAKVALVHLGKQEITSRKVLVGLVELLSYNRASSPPSLGSIDGQNQSVRALAAKALYPNRKSVDSQVLKSLRKQLLSSDPGVVDFAVNVLGGIRAIDHETSQVLTSMVNYQASNIEGMNHIIRYCVNKILAEKPVVDFVWPLK